MAHTPGKRLSVVTLLTAAALAAAAWPAAAHGGSVSPPAEQQDCRNLTLYDKGEAGHAEDGTATAGDAGSAVEWGHCG